MLDIENCEIHGDYNFPVGGDWSCPLCKNDKRIDELKDEISRRDAIIESNKSLAVELLRADTTSAALKIQLAAALNRVEKLEAGLRSFAKAASPKTGAFDIPDGHPILLRHDLSIALAEKHLRRAVELLKDVKP